MSIRRSLWLLASLAACGPATEITGNTGGVDTRALPLEGARNEAIRAAEKRQGVPAEILLVLGHHQGRFEIPKATEDELDLHEQDPATSETPDGADPLAETEAPITAEMMSTDPEETFAPEPIMELAPDETDVGLETTLAEEVDGTDPEAGHDAEADEEALMAGDVHVPGELHGLMYLTPDQVDRAAELTGLDKEAIRTDIAANVEGAAAVLRDEAEKAGFDPATRDLAAWGPVLARFVGADDAPEVTELAMKDLGDLWVEGFDLTTSDGERLALVGPGRTGSQVQELRPGQYPSIQWVAASSANYSSRRGGRVRYVVIHDMEGTMPGAISVFRNPGRQASAHYLIRARDGHIVQMVNESNNAWHCGHGYFNQNSIGIEHEGYADRPRGGGYYTERMYTSSASLVCAIAKRYHVPVDRRHIFGHGNTPSNQGSRTLCSDYQSVRGICGGRSHHHDPGRYWDWNTYMRLVARCVGGHAPAPSPSPSPSPAPHPNPPSSGGTTVKGLIYKGSNPNARIPNATVRIGSRTVRANGEGVYVFSNVPRGNQTITAQAPGYLTRSIARAVSGSETWGSIGLNPAAPSGTAKLKGIVYRGRPENRIAGATVTLSNGRTTRTNATGVYLIEGLAPGTYTIRASKSGVGAASTSRALTNGALTWGSVGL